MAAPSVRAQRQKVFAAIFQTDTSQPTPLLSSLSPDDAFILDDSADPINPAIYVWIGGSASLTERRLALQYGQHYLYKHKQAGGRAALATHIVKINQGRETEAFKAAIAGA